MSATNNRFGTFSSSANWKLLTKARNQKDFGAPALTYVKQVNWERKLGRPLNNEQDAKSTTWGKLVEKRAFDVITDLDYKLVSNVRLFHPSIDGWSGMPDILTGTIQEEQIVWNGKKVVADLKSPWTLGSFCKQIEAAKEGWAVYKEECPEYYWQLLSNAILTGAQEIEASIYVPYKHELEEIRQMAIAKSDADASETGKPCYKYNFIITGEEDELPCLIEGREYKNLNVFRFPLIEADVVELTNCVTEAVKMLK